MLYALIALCVCGVVAIAVLAHIALTLNEINLNLKKLSRRSAQTRALAAGIAAATKPQPEEIAASPQSGAEQTAVEQAEFSEAEIAAVVAVAGRALGLYAEDTNSAGKESNSTSEG